MQKPKLLVFDVNETLLDLTTLKDKVNRVLGSKHAFDVWFRMLLHYSLVETTTETYKGFGDIGKATFTMLMHQWQISLTDVQIEDVLGTIRNLPPHADVPEGLEKLRNAGFTMMALTNSSTAAMTAQLQSAGIDMYFDAAISVEEIKKYKPHGDVYRFALGHFKLKPSEAMMVAAHAWDIMGAQRCGLQTAFIMRLGKEQYLLAEKPDLITNNLLGFAEAMANT